MTVTEIKEITKSRVKVAIDGEPAFIVYKGELRAYGIKEGQEIKEEDYQTILTQVLPKRAKIRALNLLKSRAYTSFQLEEKLTMGGYPREIILEALSYVESFGYINDSQYAADFIEYNKEKRAETECLWTCAKRAFLMSLSGKLWKMQKEPTVRNWKKHRSSAGWKKAFYPSYCHFTGEK